MSDPNDLDRLFHAARALAVPEERQRFLDRECSTDAELRARLDVLLRADQRASEIFGDGGATPGEREAAVEAVGNAADELARFREQQHRPSVEYASRSVIQTLEQRLGTTLGVHLYGPEPDSVPVSVTDEVRHLRDPTGRYQMLGEIGRGGVGVVYQGRDQDLGRDVAMKVLREDHARRPELLARFIEEAQIGGQLQHPGIVPVYELGLHAGERPYFAMKLVKGETLAAQLARRSDPTADRGRLLGVFEQICQTMAYAHTRHVVHRDLKPGNVMIGAFGEVQVVDWGFAKVLARGEAADERESLRHAAEPPRSVVETLRSGSGSHSLPGSVLGTPAYMPPEQARGEQGGLDERSDVFGLGAILCELLTGEPPYVERDGDLVRQAANGALGPARQRLAGCGADAALVALCLECLAPAPAARPASAQELAERVGAHLGSVEERARQAQVRAAQATTRQRTTLVAALAIVAIVSLGTGAWIWAANRSRDELQRELDRASELKSLLSEILVSVSPEQARSADITLLRSILDQAGQRLSAGAIGDELVAAELGTLVGRVYTDIGRAEDGVPHLESARETTTRRLGAEHPDTLSAMHQLGRAYAILGRSAEARPLIEAAAASRLRLLGPAHPDTLASKVVLMRCYHTEDLDAFERLGLELVAVGRTLPEDEPSSWIGEVQGMLGSFYSVRNRHAEAAVLIAASLATLRQLHGQDHPKVVTAMLQLAQLEGQQGHLAESERIVRAALEIADRVLGPEHPLSVVAMSLLASALGGMGRLADKEALVVERMEAWSGSSSITDTERFSALLLIAGSRIDAGRLQEARADLESAQRMMPLGQTSIRQEAEEVTCLSGLTRVYRELGLVELERTTRNEWQPRQLEVAAILDVNPWALDGAARSLLAPDQPELHDPVRARTFAERACALSEQGGGLELWRWTRTLARAQGLAGDRPAAVRTMRRALELLPATADESLRNGLRASIADLESPSPE